MQIKVAGKNHLRHSHYDLSYQGGACHLELLPSQQIARMTKKTIKMKLEASVKPSVSHVFDAESPQRACSSSSHLALWGVSLGHLPTLWQLWTEQ